MSDRPAKTTVSDSPSMILDTHRRRWHDQEVFLAAQLRTIRQQQSDAALAVALCDLRAAVPGVASLSYRIGDDGAAALVGVSDAQSRAVHSELASGHASDNALEALLGAALLALSRTPVGDRLVFSVRTWDGVASLDIEGSSAEQPMDLACVSQTRRQIH